MPINGIKKLKSLLVQDDCFCEAGDILCHEQVVENRMESLYSYLKSLGDTIIVPSILVCSETRVLIDGHHRFHALRKLGVEQLPVTFLLYQDSRIVPHLDESITKQDVISTAQKGELLKPKSTFHHLVDDRGEYRPIILLGQLVDINLR